MMTEEEAKTKWCPFARVIAVTDELPYMAGNRVKNHLQWPHETILNPETARCIGSGCMAWRAAVEMSNRQADSGPPAGDGWRKVGPVTGEGGFMTKRQVWQRAVGRCGLAGQSE